MTVCVLCLFLTVSCVGLRSVSVACHGHTYLLFNKIALFKNVKYVPYTNIHEIIKITGYRILYSINW